MIKIHTIYPGQRNAVRMTLDFHFSPPNTVREERYKFSLKLNMRMEHLPIKHTYSKTKCFKLPNYDLIQYLTH